jgi:hypothetical protein
MQLSKGVERFEEDVFVHTHFEPLKPTGILMARSVLKFLRAVSEPSSPGCSQTAVHIRFFPNPHLLCSRLRIAAALFSLSMVLLT